MLYDTITLAKDRYDIVLDGRTNQDHMLLTLHAKAIEASSSVACSQNQGVELKTACFGGRLQNTSLFRKPTSAARQSLLETNALCLAHKLPRQLQETDW